MHIDDSGTFDIKSDHNLIELSISFSPQSVSCWKEDRWNIQENTNWLQFNSCAQELVNEAKQKHTSLEYNDFIKILHLAGEKAIGWKKSESWNK